MTDQSTKRRGGRPRGEIRLALAAIFRALPEDHTGLTWRDLVPQIAGLSAKSPADCELVRHTVNAMVYAGELATCGKRRQTGKCGPPMTLHRLATSQDAPKSNRGERMRQRSAALAEMLAAWPV